MELSITQKSNYLKLHNLQTKLPHALLMYDNQRDHIVQLAQIWIKQLLCENKYDLFACNICHSCTLFDNNSHPDLLTLMVDDNKSKNLTLEQIKNVHNFLALSMHRSTYKI